MGANACCAQKRLDVPLDLFNDGTPLSGSYTDYGTQYAPAAPTCASQASRSPLYPDDDFTEEVAWQVATDRCQQLYESANLINVLYEAQTPSHDQAQHTSVITHRKTGVVRQLATFQKPQGTAAQERFHSYVLSLQRLSAKSEAVAKVFEVYDDYMNLHLVQEYCTGGTIYERILERQYFTEQESAVLIKHMLLSLIPFHESRVYHGSLTPDSFRFLNETSFAPLKLVDFGIEVKAHRWDAMEHVSSGPELNNPYVPQFFETCKLVFCAPEIAPTPQPKRKQRGAASGLSLIADVQDWQVNNTCRTSEGDGFIDDLLDGELLGDVIDEHVDWLQEGKSERESNDYGKKFEAADVWSIGAISFLLLCGYPPFFAPSRNAILGRIHRGEISFDPPFWSKISEEAKSFVTGCLQPSCWDRLAVKEALEHPWIQRLADTSPSGAMFTSFMLNLRRFYRTSLIEMYVANMLATKFKRGDMHDFLRRCKEIDMSSTGFFTASDLKHVLSALGHGTVSEAITARFLRAFRHPGESYIDYIALLDSVCLRQQRIFEEELWKQFQRVCQSSGRGGGEDCGWLNVSEIGILFSDPVIVGLLMREVPESAGIDQATVCNRLRSGIRQHCTTHKIARLEFRAIAALLLKHVQSYVAPKELGCTPDTELEALETVNTVL